MPDGPVQLVINPADFVEARIPAAGGGSGKDFFAGQPEAFEAHRETIVAALTALRPASDSERVNVLVRMRPDALAKSHRPFSSVFSSSRASHVATAGYGELIFPCTGRQISAVIDLVASAELEVVSRADARGVMRPAPSPQRTETGAIDFLERWGPARDRGYTLHDADIWSASAGPRPAIAVELLGTPRDRRLRAATVAEQRRLLALPAVQRHDVQLQLPVGSDVDVRALAAMTKSVARSEGRISTGEVLAQFERSLAVKRVRLQDTVEQLDRFEGGRQDPDEVTAPAPSPPPRTRRAVVGVIDGGIAGPLESIVVGRAAVIAAEDRSVSGVNHGTEIASILRYGSGLNPQILRTDEDCDVYDIRLYAEPDVMARYFASMDEFFDQLYSDVQRARDTAGVRVFNLSLNLRAAPGNDSYSLAAQRLDELALNLDVVFVVSAGNLPTAEQRPEWPPQDAAALAMLAQVAAPDGIAAPAESLANFAVGAVNPPDLSPQIEGAPTRYSRRGGRVPSAIKPDFAATSGASPDSARASTGMRGFNSFGNSVELRGTSFAAPVLARYLASLDAAIAGGISRETLLALAVHHAEMPPLLQRRQLADIASSFVGHGLPSSVEQTLDGDPHRMTVVLSDVIRPGKRIEIPFGWPQSLTGTGGSCRGRVHLTLVTRPILNYLHGQELVRVNLDAALQQADDDGNFRGRVTATHQFFSGFKYANERTLAGELGKWSPIRSYRRTMPRGVGKSADWRLEVNYLTRAGEALPERGVPFSVVLTIEDPAGIAPVFDEMRLSLGRTNVRLNDLRTAVRVSATT